MIQEAKVSVFFISLAKFHQLSLLSEKLQNILRTTRSFAKNQMSRLYE